MNTEACNKVISETETNKSFCDHTHESEVKQDLKKNSLSQFKPYASLLTLTWQCDLLCLYMLKARPPSESIDWEKACLPSAEEGARQGANVEELDSKEKTENIKW